MTEAQKQRKLKKIEGLKKDLRYEKQRFGAYDDGYGRRYAIMELYLELKDHKKTNRYLSWFNKNFPDDITYLRFQLGIASTKFELKKHKEAKRHLVKVVSLNTYVLDLMLERPVESIEKYERSQTENLKWAREEWRSLMDLVSPAFKIWLEDFTKEAEFISYLNTYIAIQISLKGKKVGEARSHLLEKSRECLRTWEALYL